MTGESNKYIVDFNPNSFDEIDWEFLVEIEEKVSNKISISKEEADYYLSVLVFLTRKKINANLDSFDLKCDLAQSILGHYFNKIGVECFPRTTQDAITKSIAGHHFLVVEMLVDGNTVYYLVDPTYIQFFTKEKCQKSRYIIIDGCVSRSPDPGYFISSDDIAFIIEFLNCGYMVTSDNNVRIYGDSFQNTKQGIYLDLMPRQTMPGSVYLRSILKTKEALYWSEDELKSENFYIDSFKNQINKKYRPF